MKVGRTPCCLDARRRCGTDWESLRRWACALTGKGVRLVTLEGGEQAKAPFFAQPVGFDGRAFVIAADEGCDTEKLLHELCHWLTAPRDRRGRVNYGLGPGPSLVSAVESDNEELTTMLLERLLAPHFALAEERIAKPDYNVANRRNLDWDGCSERARGMYQALRQNLPPALTRRVERVDAQAIGPRIR
jgi:hypothetical protein